MGRDNQDRGIVALANDVGNGFDAIHSRHFYIEDDQVDLFVLQLAQRVFGTSSMAANREVIRFADHALHDQARDGGIVDDQDVAFVAALTRSADGRMI